MLLGCIADDFTGATDLANTLVRHGMTAVQVIGVPDATLDPALVDADAVIVALKSRTIAPTDAIAQSLDALDWLRAQGARQFIFKYCSTFDSTDQGNIGPVADALCEALGADFTIACPAFPAAGRTLFDGYLFVGEQLLSESGMKDHPLTPMRDANLVRVLSRQTTASVGLVDHRTVAAGEAGIRRAFDRLRASNHRFAILDAVGDADLLTIGAAAADLELLTGGSGLAMGLPENFRQSGLLSAPTDPTMPDIAGREAILSGSCSTATRAQVARAKSRWPAFEVDARALADGGDVVQECLGWAADQPPSTPILVYSSADPETVAAIQNDIGRDHAGGLVETAFGAIAQGLVGAGTRRLIVAGGETAGAVVTALRIPALRIGPEIAPGVPWTEALGEPRLALALKSGNFGGEDFFAEAFGLLP